MFLNLSFIKYNLEVINKILYFFFRKSFIRDDIDYSRILNECEILRFLHEFRISKHLRIFICERYRISNSNFKYIFEKSIMRNNKDEWFKFNIKRRRISIVIKIMNQTRQKRITFALRATIRNRVELNRIHVVVVELSRIDVIIVKLNTQRVVNWDENNNLSYFSKKNNDQFRFRDKKKIRLFRLERDKLKYAQKCNCKNNQKRCWKSRQI